MPANNPNTPPSRPDAPINPAPSGGAGETPAGAGPGRERRKRKILPKLVGAAFAGLFAAGILTYAFGDDKPKKVPRGPNILDPIGASPNTALQGDQLRAKIRDDVQRQVNNGENGKTTHIAPGILTINTRDGQKVSYANPIVATENLSGQAADQLKAGKLDTSILDGRVFALGTAKDTPMAGHDKNFDRGVVPIDVTDTGATFTPAPGFHIVDAAVNWESPDPVAVDKAGDPLEINIRTGEVAQHKVDATWHTLAVGQQVPTPHA